jgi:hypothetical protein
MLGMSDPRLPSNATKYRIGDAVLGAFSVFFIQSESFLEHQRQMESNQGKSNATTLFGMIKVPTVPQIRNIMDGISANSFLHLTDLACQQICHKRVTRQGFFQDILSLTKYLLFESWPSLIDFMLYGSKPNLAANSS